MKKIIAFILAMVMMMSVFTACGNVGSVSGGMPAEFEEAGYTQEEYDAMSDEMKQALRDELGVKINLEENKEEAPKPTEKPKAATIADVENGGSYVVTVGDGWNYVELHYEDGKLVSITTHFQKNDEEDPEIETVTGDAVKDYGLYFIDYTDTPSKVVQALQDNGFNGVRVKRVQ